MKFTYFTFKNFKGINNQKLDLTKSSGSNIFTLVGLNESGKTTILEAINFFSHKPESLDVLGLDLADDEIKSIKKAFRKEENIILSECSNKISYTHNYYFKNSIHQPDRNESLWTYSFKGRKKRANSRDRKINNDEAQAANSIIKENIPSILYFPNFLFEFPERIYLEDSIEDAKHIFYQKIIQDVLDSLQNETNIQEHLIERINSGDENKKRNLTSLIGKMEKQLSKIVFESWNEIFSKKISQKEIVLYAGKDDKGTYIEFNIKDDVDTYRINERSLGFRWFFVYILLTQFRTYRKKNSNAFFLFDEPASNLHPSAQSELLKSFENLPNVLYTTHSHYLINPKWLESTYVVKNKGIDYDNEAEYNSKNTDISIMKYRGFVSKFPSQTSYFQPILEILEYKPANLELIQKVVLTEGKNDFYIFNYYQDVIKRHKHPLKFVPGTSASNMTNLISLYLGWGAKFVVLLDSDGQGIDQKERYIALFGSSVKDIIITYKDICPEWTNFETENLFTENDLVKIQEIYYPYESIYKKKILNRSVQENYIMSECLNLDNESNSNFKKVLDYLKEKLK